ncbi:hypothetical protein A2U01_0037577, partial [Trifolium medium]|nr:hypothetical protein [Trifolium medium]
YPDLFIEASEKSSKLSVLVAMAKVPHSFPSGSGFGLLDQFIYDITRGVDRSQHKTSTTERWSAASVCRHVLNVLFLPVKLLGMLIPILLIYHHL